jgi:hypothetical protein
LPVWNSKRTENSEGVKMDKIVSIDAHAQMEAVQAPLKAPKQALAEEETSGEPSSVQVDMSAPADDQNLLLEAKLDE